MSVRPKTIYMDGIPKTFLRRTKEDYWQRELEQIGQQEIHNAEVYASGTAVDQEVFGYQDRYFEYKQQPSTVCGEFRQLLDYWHYGRKFSSTPALNGSFVSCVPTDRVYQETTQNELLVQVHHSVQARRMVTKSNASRIY
jgi:hypothetical protein